MDGNLSSGQQQFRIIFDAFPSPVLIVDSKLQIHDANRACLEMFNRKTSIIHKRLCGDLIRCVNAKESETGCGTTKHCPSCIIRQTADDVMNGRDAFRRLGKIRIEKKGQKQQAWLLVSGSLFAYQNDTLAIVTLEDISELMDLRKMIPICMHCRKLRDDEDYWHSVENFFTKYTDVEFTHSLCPECAKKHYPHLEL